MVYTMFLRDGKNVGAMYQMPPEMQGMGIPPNWLTYVTVESVDESAAKATSLGGMMQITPEMGGGPPCWLNYFAVEDCDAVVARATAKGGQAIVPAMDVEGIGRFAVVQDPQGAAFAVIRLTEPM